MIGQMALVIGGLLAIVALVGPFVLLCCFFTWRGRWRFYALLPATVLICFQVFQVANSQHNFLFQARSVLEFMLPALMMITRAVWVIVLPLRYRAAQRRSENERD
jgi:hypothetical protein